MTVFNYKLANGTNRALVCYCTTADGALMKEKIAAVFAAQNIEIEQFIDDGSETVWTIANVVRLVYSEPLTRLDIALQYADKIKQLKVGGEFRDVCVGVYCYNQPAPPPEPEPGPDDPEPEPQPEPPSITSLVCDALRETFGGTFGASAFVINPEQIDFKLEVK